MSRRKLQDMVDIMVWSLFRQDEPDDEPEEIRASDCPLVIIRWLDSTQPEAAWKHVSDLPDYKPVEIATVGWLLKDTDDVKVIAQSVGGLNDEDNAQVCGVMSIPSVCVLSIEKLIEEDE